jgi:ABC-type hemin transport system ATPase subunit
MERVALMRNGRILLDSPAADALRDARLSELYGADISTFERNGRRYISHG